MAEAEAGNHQGAEAGDREGAGAQGRGRRLTGSKGQRHTAELVHPRINRLQCGAAINGEHTEHLAGQERIGRGKE